MAGIRLLVMTPMTYFARRLTITSGLVGLVAVMFQPLQAMGQAAPAEPAASAAAPAAPRISDRVKKDAASPLYWIRLNAQKTDSAPAKPAPRIVEVKPVVNTAAAAPTRPAPSAPTPSSPAPVVVANSGSTPAGSGASLAGTDGASSSAGGQATAAAATSAPIEATLTLSAPPPLSAGGAPAALAVGAGLAAPSGAAAATEAARTATAPPAEEPDDQPLTLVSADEPEFPIIAVRRLRKGNVQVRFEVQPDGSVANPTVVTSTNRSLNEAALEAVAAWRFEPVRSPRSAVVDLGFDLDS